MSDLFQGLTGLGAAISQVNALTGPGFEISEEAGGPLVRAIGDFDFTVERLQHELNRLSVEPPLGTTPAAQVYKPFLASIASDPVQGSVVVLEDFKKKLAHMSEQITQAMELYRVTDENARNTLTKNE